MPCQATDVEKYPESHGDGGGSVRLPIASREVAVDAAALLRLAKMAPDRNRHT